MARVAERAADKRVLKLIRAFLNAGVMDWFARRILAWRLSITPATAKSRTTSGEINAAFGTIARERPDALLVAADAFFVSCDVQFTTLAARERIPAIYPICDFAVAGGLMSYGTVFPDVFHQVGVYVGLILMGTPPDLPVVQSTRFEFVIIDSSNTRPRAARASASPLPSRSWRCTGAGSGSNRRSGRARRSRWSCPREPRFGRDRHEHDG